ncbi:MSHA biogenesis protein MshJ [Zobellella endophytica]|uniref:MSHA biogenesis protein MshJ n=1 Tax=Zobellella endophytica TaxID=2116700 RepID=A0A2P7RBZ2_9GAMM|nr:MSHA biogenesis protein MshJ [Zobellella endophytica]PSJ47758.1 MSHA biogenesis protein MshJ [Zobellella endophytica]
MSQWINRLERAFMARTGRERWLLLCAGWALLAWLLLLVYEQTVQHHYQARMAEQRQVRQTLDGQQARRLELEQGIARLSGTDHRRQLERLNRRLASLNETVENRMRTLVGPEQMAALLLSVLEQQGGLELRQMTSQPPQAVTVNEGETLYRHGLSLQLGGSYMQLLDYVQRLERLSGRIFWHRLEFELEQYPRGVIRLDFFTISQHKELLRG